MHHTTTAVGGMLGWVRKAHEIGADATVQRFLFRFGDAFNENFEIFALKGEKLGHELTATHFGDIEHSEAHWAIAWKYGDLIGTCSSIV